MATKMGVEVSVAIGDVVKLANADVVAAYPLPPKRILLSTSPS